MSIRPQFPAIEGIKDTRVGIILAALKSSLEAITGRTPNRPQLKLLGDDATLGGVINKVNEIINRLQENDIAGTGKPVIPAVTSTASSETVQPYVATLLCPGVPTASQLIGIVPAPAGITTITYAAAIAGSSGKSLTAATAQTDVDVRKNAVTSGGGSSVGTVRWAAAGTVPTFIAASGFTLTGGTDYLTLWGPSSPDATLADFAIALYGTR